MRRYLLIFILIITSFTISGFGAQLNENSRVVLFTCGPSAGIMHSFGHSAIWINDSVAGVNRVYDYGYIDINSNMPVFLWRFIQKKIDHKPKSVNFDRFINCYKRIDVDGQTLNLTLHEKQKLQDLLQENLKPENCYSKYDLTNNNCATKLRDVIFEVVEGEIDFQAPNKIRTFRKAALPYLSNLPWTKTGLSIVFGAEIDKMIMPYRNMYVPRCLEEEFRLATVTNEGETRRLVKSQTQYYQSNHHSSHNKVTTPTVFFSILFLLIVSVTIFELKKGFYFKWLDVLSFCTNTCNA